MDTGVCPVCDGHTQATFEAGPYDDDLVWCDACKSNFVNCAKCGYEGLVVSYDYDDADNLYRCDKCKRAYCQGCFSDKPRGKGTDASLCFKCH